MQKIILDITMSLDGFIAGPDITTKQPMGKDGQRLHEWIFNKKTDTDTKLITEIVQSSGAVIVGSRTYVTAIDKAWEGASPFGVPAFVVCTNLPETIVPGFTFVTDGITSVLTKAKAVAGEKNIWVMGGASIIQQFLKEKLFDDLHLHIAPIILTKGTRLFEFIGEVQIELKKTKVTDTPGVTHMQFEIVR